MLHILSDDPGGKFLFDFDPCYDRGRYCVSPLAHQCLSFLLNLVVKFEIVLVYRSHGEGI